MARLLEQYRDEIVPRMVERLGYTNKLAVPRIEKVVVNMGVGRATENRKRLDDAARDLGTITGQKPVISRARKSVSAFRLREGQPIGCKVTLRGKRMYEFLDRLISLAMPRIRDFRGINPNAFDGRGGFNMGLTEQIVFPEVDVDDVEFVQGMDICIRITGNSDEVSRELLRLLGFPFSGTEAAQA
jgi:large subunit ribosomal protein L5